MDSDTLLAILKRAVNAPSGENCQPWRFRWKEGEQTLYVYNIPLRDQSLYNVKQSGSLIAHGALIENISLVASTHGYQITVQVVNGQSDGDLVAMITFKKSGLAADLLAEFIEKRCTNRKKYQLIAISEVDLADLSLKPGGFSGVEIKFIDKKTEIESLSSAMSMNERIVFEHPQIHHFFFSHIRWTKEEEEREKNGFYLPTLELDEKQKKAMRVFRKWPILKILNYLGISRMIAKDNEKNYASSSCFGAILINNLSKESLIAAGRAFQRIWLTVTQKNWSLQPATGIVLLSLAIEQGAALQFTDKQRGIINIAQRRFLEAFKVNEKQRIAVMFRIGNGGQPSAYSQKMPPELSLM